MLIVGVPFFAQAAQSTDENVILSKDKRKALLDSVVGDKANTLSSQAEYVIGHGDILTVSIFEEGDMAASARVGSSRSSQMPDSPRIPETGIRVMMDGRISLKDVGDVEVVGLTLTELANYLKKLYEVIYTEPIVTTTLVQSNSLRYTVMGEVQQAGVFYLDYPVTLVQAIARSGGFAEWASKKVTLVRKNVNEREKELFEENSLEFDYDDFI